MFLVESLSQDHPPGLLPLRIDVLWEVLWQEKHGGKISCPLLHESRDIKCENSAVGCQSSDSNQSSQCSVRKLLLMWREAGISTISAKQVKVKIEELLTEYKKLRKSMGKQTIAAVTSRSNFQEKLQVCFDILAPDAKDHIEKDKLRTRAAKDADLSFIEDQISGARKFCFSKVDKTYSARVEKHKIREIESEDRMLRKKPELPLNYSLLMILWRMKVWIVLR